jgi:hypothetical protein
MDHFDILPNWWRIATTLHLPNREKISIYRAKLPNYRVAVTTLVAYNRKEIAIWMLYILEKLERSSKNSG